MKYRILEEKEYNKSGYVIRTMFYPQERLFGFWWRKITIGCEYPETVWYHTHKQALEWIDEQIKYKLKKVTVKTEKQIWQYGEPYDLEK